MIPLIPFVSTVIVDIWHGASTAKQAAYNLFGVHARRLVLYYSLFIFRTVCFLHCFTLAACL